MQALVNTPQVLNWITTHNPRSQKPCTECSHKAPCAACTLKKVMQSYFTGSQQDLAVAVSEFDRNFVNKLWPQLARGLNENALARLSTAQQDAQEFLQFIGDSLKILNPKTKTTKPMPIKLYDALFTVTSRWTWKCPTCNSEHPSQPQTEFGQYITTNTPARHLSVQKYIDHEYRGELINGVTCDKCNATGLMVRRIAELLAAPDVLFIGLRCFDYGPAGQRKVLSNVTLDQRLDLTRHQPVEQRKEHTLTYELKHVVYHVGSTPKHGHYYGMFTTPTGVYELNDSHVAQASSLVKPVTKGGNMPYVLVYSRIEN